MFSRRDPAARAAVDTADPKTEAAGAATAASVPRQVETALQQAVAAGDGAEARRLFGQVIARMSEPLYRQIRRLVGVHEDADDILQNTFLKAWTNIDQFRGEARLSTWLHKIAINESLSHLAAARRRPAPQPDADEALAALHADPSPDGDDLARRLRQAVETLPDKQRIIFGMRYYDEMKYEDISHILGTSVGALKASYHQAVKKIEKIFSDH